MDAKLKAELERYHEQKRVEKSLKKRHDKCVCQKPIMVQMSDLCGRCGREIINNQKVENLYCACEHPKNNSGFCGLCNKRIRKRKIRGKRKISNLGAVDVTPKYSTEEKRKLEDKIEALSRKDAKVHCVPLLIPELKMVVWCKSSVDLEKIRQKYLNLSEYNQEIKKAAGGSF